MSDASAAQVVIYTSRWCGYCHAAKRLLGKLDVPFEEINVEGRADLREWLVTASGQHTVPQVFINQKSIGGYSELSTLHSAGALEALLQESSNPKDASAGHGDADLPR